ncbi:MAG: ribonuclease J [Saccharofermentanales bacterium]|jgi:ribonuclease J
MSKNPAETHHNLFGTESRIKIVPLGGMREFGKNMTAFQWGNDIIIVDVGIGFPDEEMPGVDLIIPDFSWLKNQKERVRALFLTHGHEDHVGAITWFLREHKVPVYGTAMTIKLVENKLNDSGRGARDQGSVIKNPDLHVVNDGDRIRAGALNVEFVHVNHSIADACALLIETPVGNIFHTGDFKIDYTPVHGLPIDLNRIAQIGSDGLLAMVAESANVEIDGFSPSEQIVGETFAELFAKIRGRIFVSTFSSNIFRMQQIITAAEQFDRKVAMVGRSMINAFEAADSLGYIDFNQDTIIDIKQINDYPPQDLVIITTGTQGEPMSALTRMAYSQHRDVAIEEGDTVLMSSSMIPGNEKAIYRVINELFKRGANVIYKDLADIHVSGHAYSGEMALMLNLLKPKYFIPAHGEYRHLYHHAKIAENLGVKQENIFLLNNGDILELNNQHAEVVGFTEAAGILIDGSGIGGIDDLVLRDRLLLADDGVVAIFIVVDSTTNHLAAEPIIEAKGFIYESEIDQVIKICHSKINDFVEKSNRKKKGIKKYLKDRIDSGQLHQQIRQVLFELTKRRPMLIISTVEV